MAQQNNLDFNIAANVKGMEQIATLINRVNALEAETKKLASANANLTNSNNSVIQSGTRYNNALDAQSKQLRNARQGTQQLGMQINDFATSVSTGASVSQAFNQQLGQLGYAMSMMGGTAGKVGAFLAGPWGAAITLAVVALGPFIDKLGQAIIQLFNTETALDRVAKSANNSMNALRSSVAQASKESDAMTATAQSFAVASSAYAKARNQLERARKMGPADDSDPASVFAYQRQLEKLSQQERAAKAEMDKFENRVSEIGMLSRAKGMQVAASAIQNKAPKTLGGSAAGAARALSPLQKEAQKEAQALARWEAMSQGQRVEAYDDYRSMLIKSDQAWAKNVSKIEDEVARNNIDRAEKMTREISYIMEDFNAQQEEQIKRPYQALQESFKSIGQSVSDTFQGMITGATSWKDALRGIIGSVIDELWRLYVVQQIVGFVTKAIGGIGLPLPAPVPGKAVGGYVGAQKPYVVGEKGPELFIPGGSGTIIPNKNMAMGSGGGGVTVNVDARGSADPAAVRAQVEQGILQAAPAIIAAAQQRTVAGLRRPKLGGAMQ